mmetsp:Transcript_19081/g.59981  ORF Transcript_19081/g.59981 Transcript_19081/m.59981 type:complete len:107 (+) Transcript_19081:2-322(+)
MDQVKQALEAFDAQVEELRKALDNEQAKMVFETLSAVYAQISAAVAKALESEAGQQVIQSLQDLKAEYLDGAAEAAAEAEAVEAKYAEPAVEREDQSEEDAADETL